MAWSARPNLCPLLSEPGQLKRNRDRVRPFMIEEGILPDETKKDKLAVAMTQLLELASRWGLPQKDPEFTKKYTSERTLCQFLAEYCAVVELERESIEVCTL